MNDQTAALLNQLAQKMGTTVQYLWGILIRQAPIDATITLIQFLIVGIATLCLYKTHIKLMSPIKYNKHGYTGYEKYSEGAAIPMILGLLILIILIICCLLSIDDVINGYFNPEYWALRKVLDSTK